MERDNINNELDTEANSLLLHTNNSVDLDHDHDDGSSCVTPVLVLSTFVAVCSSFCYGCAVGYSSPAESGIREELGLSVSQYSVFGSIMTVGSFIGAVLSGRVADLIGRRRDALCLDIGRISIGIGIGLVSYVVPVYIAEIAPKNVRGRFTIANQMMTSTGFGLFFFVGNFLSWRAFPCVVQFIGLFFIPESPRQKLVKKKGLEAALRRLRGKQVDISREAADIRDYTESFQQISGGRFLDLFQMRYASALTIGMGLMLCQQLGGTSAITYYIGSIYEQADVSSVIGTTGIAALQIPTALIALFLMDKCGRRPLLLISSSGFCFCCLVIGFAFCLKEHQYMKLVIPLMMLFSTWGAAAFFEIGMSGIPWVIMSEIFPINVKGSAGSVVTSVNWACSWITTYTFNFVLEWSISGTFFIFAGIWCVSIIFIAKMVPETKGRSLKEIQASIIKTVD